MEEFVRPSSFEAIELCPGRPSMEARAVALIPALRDMCSEPARQGTLGHEVIAGMINDAFAGDWSQAAAIIAGMEGRMAGLAYWCKDAVRHCIAYAFDLIRRHVPRYCRIEVLTERKLAGRGIKVPRGGSADLVLLCYDDAGVLDLVVVVDWKCGFTYQGEAADHLQLGCYAVMCADAFGPRHGVDVHLAMGRRHEFSSAHYDGATIEGVRLRITAAGARARTADPELRACLKACRYCRALTTCGAAREFMMTTINEVQHFGADPADRVQLAEVAALAKRFAADADALAKHWRAQEAEKCATASNHFTN
jgi:hypothetical protein